MRAEHINPFFKSLSDTFATMLGCQTRRGPVTLAAPGSRPFPISAVIGLSGKAVGAVVINLSEELALKAASAMLMTECATVDADVIDAVGELANVVAGQAKAQLEEYELSVSLPSVILGAGHEIRFPTDAPAVSAPFDTDFGPMRLEVGMAAVKAAIER